MLRMGRFLIGAALAFLSAPALACTCDDPKQLSPAQAAADLKLLASQELRIGQVVRMDGNLLGQARRYRVLDDLTGNLPPVVIVWPNLTRLADGSFVQGPLTSCNFDGEPGKIFFMAFHVARDGRDDPVSCGVLSQVNDSGLRSAGSCVNYYLEDADFRAKLVAATKAQSGVSRSSRPLSSKR